MPRPRFDTLLVPSVSWTDTAAPADLHEGLLVGTPNLVVLVPRQHTRQSPNVFGRLANQTTVNHHAPPAEWLLATLADPHQPLDAREHFLGRLVPPWPGRCVFAVRFLSRFEMPTGFFARLGGLSLILQQAPEPPTSVRIATPHWRDEMRAFYGL
jgi:hypothetical protein